MGDLSKHFSKREFACKCGCGFDAINPLLVEQLEKVRLFFGAPVTVVSGCRCEAHNKAVGGVKASQHVLGNAADITVKGVQPERVAAFLEQVFSGRYGVGRYAAFTHFDVRKGAAARWKG